MGAVKAMLPGDVHLTPPQPVAIGQAKRLLPPQQMGHPRQPPASLRLFAGVDQRHAPGLGRGAQHLAPAGRHIDHDVRREPRVVEEELLDLPAAIARQMTKSVIPCASLGS